MTAAINWDNVNIAGAFVVGAIFGTIATIRIMHAVIRVFSDSPSTWRRRRKKENDNGDSDRDQNSQ